ncbi:hypothetical protein [Streptomyces sp. NPDC050535]|uniref:hypothetical protein n=1 Tax=Streptomyces sp. NPDC050535 TaxID=3365626 RepID=UPI0037B03520
MVRGDHLALFEGEGGERGAPRAAKGGNRLAWGSGASFPVTLPRRSVAVRVIARPLGSAVAELLGRGSHALGHVPDLA